MIIGGVIAICILLLGLGMGSRAGSKAPGKLGSWLSKPFNKSMKATDKSASTGREARSKLPL